MIAAYTWGTIAVVVVASTAGDVFISRAMKRIGDVGELRQRRGLLHVIERVLGSPSFLAGIGCMTVGFFALMMALSWADVSLVGPVSASLTYISNALSARLFLKEHVDRRRWAAAAFVAAGVLLMDR